MDIGLLVVCIIGGIILLGVITILIIANMIATQIRDSGDFAGGSGSFFLSDQE